MRINVNYEMPVPQTRGPYEFYGRFTCDGADEREENMIALFAEYAWPKYAHNAQAVSFSPGLETAAFFVNAKTREQVKSAIDDAVGHFTSLLKPDGCQVTIEKRI